MIKKSSDLKDRIIVCVKALGGLFSLLKVITYINIKKEKNIDDENAYIKKFAMSQRNSNNIYISIVKPAFDVILSFCGLLFLSPIFVILSGGIFLDDPGPVFFVQKRVGKDKKFFYVHKFRSMKIDAPHDTPTHQLADSEQYITNIGRIMRKYSLDELPQLWDIFRGKMSIIGPRPALWNQSDLLTERDKWDANDIKPGLTGLAQIKGRDELSVPEKAKLDGIYANMLRKGSTRAFFLDVQCFLRTFGAVFKHRGVVEGGKTEFNKSDLDQTQAESESPKVSIGVVTYNSDSDVIGLFDSLRKSRFQDFKIYVLDNASVDDTVLVIQEKYPEIKLYTSRKNLGFGLGHNKIIDSINSEYHIICNPDIRVKENTIRDCVTYMDEHKDVVVMTPSVRNFDGSQQFLPKKNPSIKYMIGGMFEKRSKICKKLRQEYTLQTENITSPVEVEFCTGCYMVVRTSALKKVGGFDERYFLHFEDADLTRELCQVGRAVYNPDIEIVHEWHRDNKKWNKNFFVALQSMFKYMWKWKSF